MTIFFSSSLSLFLGNIFIIFMMLMGDVDDDDDDEDIPLVLDRAHFSYLNTNCIL